MTVLFYRNAIQYTHDHLYITFVTFYINRKGKSNIDLLQKSHSAPVPYPTMHHFIQKCVPVCIVYLCVYFYYKMVHGGIFIFALWDLWDLLF